MKIGDWVKLRRFPREVGEAQEIHDDGTCVVVGPFDDVLTSDHVYFQFDPSQIDAWEPATDDDVFNARFMNGSDYGDWWKCRACGHVGREPEIKHDGDCPVAEALRLRRALEGKDESKLLAEVANFLADQGYPWTANMIRDGSWRKR